MFISTSLIHSKAEVLNIVIKAEYVLLTPDATLVFKCMRCTSKTEVSYGFVTLETDKRFMS